MEKESARAAMGRGIDREQLQGRLQDPTGVDPFSVDRETQNDQRMPSGGEGREGGAAGKFTGGFPEGGEPGPPGGRILTEPGRGKREETS